MNARHCAALALGLGPSQCIKNVGHGSSIGSKARFIHAGGAVEHHHREGAGPPVGRQAVGQLERLQAGAQPCIHRGARPGRDETIFRLAIEREHPG